MGAVVEVQGKLVGSVGICEIGEGMVTIIGQGHTLIASLRSCSCEMEVNDLQLQTTERSGK